MRKLSRVWFLGALAATAMVGMAALSPAPAHATSAHQAPAHTVSAHQVPDGILVSTDGTHFAATASDPLFDPARVIVPGGQESASLYIRNDSKRSLVISLHATKVTFTSVEFGRLLELSASSAGNAGTSSARLSDGQCLPLLSDVSLPAGTTTHLNLNLVMSAGAQGSAGQDQTARFDVLVSARDRSEPVLPGATCATGTTVPGLPDPAGPVGPGGVADPAPLADTGSDLLVPLAAGALLFGVGAALVVGARRSRKRDATEHDR